MTINPYQSPTPETTVGEPEGASEIGASAPFPAFGLWVPACAAALLGAVLAFDYITRDLGPLSVDGVNFGITFLYLAVWATQAVVAFTLLGLIAYRRTIYGFYAGHWLCLISALPLLCNRLPAWVYGEPLLGSVTLELVSASLLAAASLAPAFFTRPRLPLVWQTYFISTVVVQSLHFILIFQGRWGRGIWFDYCLGFSLAVSALLFVAGFIWEIARRRPMDWAHWIGVLSPAVPAAVRLLLLVYFALAGSRRWAAISGLPVPIGVVETDFLGFRQRT